jgi:hypothetical protein
MLGSGILRGGCPCKPDEIETIWLGVMPIVFSGARGAPASPWPDPAGASGSLGLLRRILPL